MDVIARDSALTLRRIKPWTIRSAGHIIDSALIDACISIDSLCPRTG